MAVKGKTSKKKERNEIERPVRYKKYKQFFLIVCEDENTEPKYFQQFIPLFPEETLFLKPVGVGRDPKGVVHRAIFEREDLKQKAHKEIDFVWAVFDKDDADENQTKINNFEDALQIAKDEKIEIAFSNEVFEVWLLLHLKDIDPAQPIPRKVIYDDLQESIRNFEAFQDFEYQHGKESVLEVIKIIGKEDNAIKRAEKLLSFHIGKKPIESNPSTKVHLLVKELRGWIDYYNYEP